jgi:hypothetical protein
MTLRKKWGFANLNYSTKGINEVDYYKVIHQTNVDVIKN